MLMGVLTDATIAITVNNASPTATITNNSSSTEITCNLTSISVTGGGAGTGGSTLGIMVLGTVHLQLLPLVILRILYSDWS